MTDPASRARASKELGEEFAKALQEAHAHQLGVCAKLGILEHQHHDWMRSKAEPGTPVAEYRLAVLRGLDEQRRKDLTDIEVALEAAETGKATPVLNMRKWRHESRFKRFYDDAAKVEVTGKDGGPIQHEHKYAHLSDAELDAKLRESEE